MIAVTGSQLERALECPASTCLPQVKNTNPWAQEGTALHDFLEMTSKYDRDTALQSMRDDDDWEKYADVCEAIDTDSLPTELAHEVAFAYDVVTRKVRELGRGKVDYSKCNLNPNEIPCRLDVVGVSPSAVFVGDYKFGRGDVTPAKRNVQVGFGALCATTLYGRDNAVVEIIRPGRGGAKPFHDRAELDMLDLDALALRLSEWFPRRRGVLSIIESGDTPNVFEGDWCKWCPSYNYCPAKTALAVRIGDGSEIQELHTELTPETAAAVYKRAKMASELLRKVFGSIYGMARNEPIDLGDGKMLGETTKRGNERLDGQTVRAVLQLLHTEEIADEAVEITATKAAIERALRGKVAVLAPAIREVLTKVAELGGIRRHDDTTKVREYDK